MFWFRLVAKSPLLTLSATIVGAFIGGMLGIGGSAAYAGYANHRANDWSPSMKNVVTKATCDPNIFSTNATYNVTGIASANSRGRWVAGAYQSICIDLADTNDHVVRVHVHFDSLTGKLHVTWSAALPVKWLTISVGLHGQSGWMPTYPLKEGQTSYDQYIPLGQWPDFVIVNGDATSLPPPVAPSSAGSPGFGIQIYSFTQPA